MGHRLLVIASDAVDRIRYRSEFSAAGYDVMMAEKPGDAVVGSNPPDAVLAKLTADPLRQLGDIRAAFGDRPVAIGIGQPDAGLRLQAIAAGFSDIVTQMPVLRARLRNAMRQSETVSEAERRRSAAQILGLAETRSAFQTPRQITLVGDVAVEIEAEVATRKNWRIKRCTVSHCLADDRRADVYILGPGVETDVILPELRARDHSRRSAILSLHDIADEQGAVRALDARASDVAPAWALPAEIALRVERALTRKDSDDALRRQADASMKLAMTDPLTGLYNRRYAHAYLGQTLSDPDARDDGYCAMMIDIDRFKQVNDTYGHATGDQLIRMISEVLRNNLRAMDMVARLGGDEFLVVMPKTTPEEAGMAAERLRDRVAGESIAVKDGQLGATLSIGVAIKPATIGPAVTADDLLAAADAALYVAKAAGRNCVHLVDTAA